MAKKNAKRGKTTLKSNKPEVAEIPYLTDISVHDEDSLREVLEVLTQAQESIAVVNKFVEIARNQATGYMHSHAMPVVQLEGSYWRKIQRKARFWVNTDAEMPDPAPKGAKSLKALCQGKTAKSGKKIVPLWNFITKRVVDPKKIDEAVAKGFITEKEINRAYLEADQKPFIQRFQGEAIDAEDE